MSRQHLPPFGVLAIAVAVASLVSVSLAGQAPTTGTTAKAAPNAQPTAGAKTWTAKTVWGDPDLQGVWSYASLTPLERPAALAGREFFTPAEAAAPVAPAAAAAVAPVALTDADLRRVCRAGLAAIHGQEESSITIDALNGPIVNVSWRAPVDGGRRRAQCRVDDDLVIWRPADRTQPVDERWMDQAGDPVTRFVLDGETVTINQTLPDSGAVADDQGRG